MTPIKRLLAAVEAMEAAGDTESDEYEELCEEYMAEALNIIEGQLLDGGEAWGS